MENIKRILKLKLLNRKSAFLWGARKTGKTIYLKRYFIGILMLVISLFQDWGQTLTSQGLTPIYYQAGL